MSDMQGIINKKDKRNEEIILFLFFFIIRLDTHLKMVAVNKPVEHIVIIAHLIAALLNMFALLVKLRLLKPFTLSSLRVSALIMGLLLQ